jgi:two-component system cell cycle sensor histidine kinase/response regulator CckA
MPETLRVLMVEDSEADAELLVHELERSGYELVAHRVQTADAMESALSTAQWDIVISDYSMPTFTAPAALRVLQRSGVDLPFIIVSGTIGEDTAVSALKLGAHDFLVKGRLARLIPAIERERRDFEQRKAHRRSREALEASEARFRSLVEHAVFGIYQVSVEGQFLSVNPAMVSMLKYDSADELLNTHVSNVYADPEVRQEIARRCLDEGTVSSDAMWKRKDGAIIRVRVNGRVSQDRFTGQPVFEVIVEDITVRHELQEQLRQSQRMEVIGQLAGGVAHDFNNMLTAILGYSELLTEQIGPDKPIGQDLLQIKAAAERAAALTRHLLAFSRKQVLSVTTINLSDVVRSLVPVFRRLLGERVKIVTILADDLDPVMADGTQLEHALVNLCVNARDAMPQGGTVRIGTHNKRLGEAYTRANRGSIAGDYAALTVSDDGTGIPAEIQSKIFEPFFTTKEVGRGTGLGLSAVFGTVKQLNGYIEVDSTVGVGTTFTIYLPRTEQAHVPRQRAMSSGSPVGAETILLVEDEAGVRAFAKTVLQRFGYRVLEADSGERAIAIMEECTEPIHLLLSDVVLPGMDGPQLADRVLREYPRTRLLYMSGYADRLTQIEGVLAPGVELLAKPFTAQALLKKVRELLGAAQLDVA